MNVEVYGFIFWLASFAWLGLWILWAFCPDEFIRESIGITYFPSKWWAVGLPTYVIVVVFMSSFAYFGLTLATTKPLDSKFLISDESTVVTAYATGDDHDIPSAYDLPLRLVNHLMYERRTSNNGKLD